jgi:NhaA family Na+:H+ antiporter
MGQLALGEIYTSLWQVKLTIGLGDFALAKPLLLWINDGLMAIFFFVVGLEIKREIVVGELASVRKAALPLAAALGGMVVPAALYAGLNAGTPGAPGWGIPMATDIAFALGVLALLGKRAPLSLKIFLTAFAIVDDLGAVLVIAVFYTAEIVWISLAAGAAFLGALVVANRLGIRHPLVYGVLGVGLWVAFLKSGVHATVAGVLLAMTIPLHARIEPQAFLTRARRILDTIQTGKSASRRPENKHEEQSAIQALESICKQAESPLQRTEHVLHPWVTFAIVPIFALANAGVSLGGGISSAFTQTITLGVVSGLVFGKQLGITLFAWLTVRMGLADLPTGLSWRQIYGASLLGGIGFTMSIFIANLAFGDDALLTLAKVGVLTASLVSAIAGLLILRTTKSPSASGG